MIIKIKKISAILIANLIIISSLTGCFKTNSKFNFVHQPLFDEEFENIYKTLLKSTYSNEPLTLVAPKDGKNTSKINLFTNVFNQQFAIIFYKNDNNYQNENVNHLRLAILQKDEHNHWKLKLTIPFNGATINEFYITKNENNHNFLIIDFNYQINQNYEYKNSLDAFNAKKIAIYNFDVNNFHEILSDDANVNLILKQNEYKAMKLCNFGNNKNKLIIITAKNDHVKPSLSILNLQENKIELENNNNAELNFANIFKIKTDFVNYDRPLIFVDEKIKFTANDENIQTEVFEYKNNQFSKILESKPTSYRTQCLDVDNDGKLEIPEIETFANYQILEKPTIHIKSSINGICLIIKNFKNIPLITNWRKLKKSNGKFSYETIKTYTNKNYGWGFILPASWSSKNIYANYLNKNTSIEFGEFEKNNQNLKNKKLLTITSLNNEQKPPPGFFLLKNNGPFSFWAKLYITDKIKNKNLIISQQQITRSFFIMKGL